VLYDAVSAALVLNLIIIPIIIKISASDKTNNESIKAAPFGDLKLRGQAKRFNLVDLCPFQSCFAVSAINANWSIYASCLCHISFDRL
jgi:hypothetical protein